MVVDVLAAAGNVMVDGLAVVSCCGVPDVPSVVARCKLVVAFVAIAGCVVVDAIVVVAG